MRLLYAGDLEVFQDHLGEGLLGAVFGTVFLQSVNQLVVLIHAEHAVGAEALNSEGTGDTNLSLVLVGFVVEINWLSLYRY